MLSCLLDFCFSLSPVSADEANNYIMLAALSLVSFLFTDVPPDGAAHDGTGL